MPRIVEVPVYEIGELSDKAKEKARAWYREHCMDFDWYDFVFEDFGTICGLIGIDLSTSTVRLMGGGTRDEPKIYFRGFWSQGDGASFEGVYRYACGGSGKLRNHAPKDAELHAIADALQDIQKRNFYQLVAGIRQQGRYCHEFTMAVEVERDSGNYQDMTADAEDVLTEAFRDLARWLYRRLREEYEHLTSDAAIDESIAANEWTFTEAGVRFGQKE